MDSIKSFSCPKCKNKLPFWYTIKVSKDRSIPCPVCSANVQPINLKSWQWGWRLGIITGIIPSEVCLYFYDNIVFALSVGLLVGLSAIFLIGYHIFTHTKFKLN